MVGYHVYHLFLCQHPPLLEVLKYMSEAIISRRGWGEGGKPQLRTETIVQNNNWKVPEHVGSISIRIFGGGAAGDDGRYATRGGGSGWMNNGELSLNTGETVRITIGKGGNAGGSGGTTSFGSHLSANGGSGASGGAGGAGSYRSSMGYTSGGRGYQFGGGGGYTSGSAGGIWGGGSGGGSWFEEDTSGGNGGTYGGGGGTGASGNATRVGRGGTYGGNGAFCTDYNLVSTSEAGTNTIGDGSVPEDCQGNGAAGRTFAVDEWWACGGGGGYGGPGGNGIASHSGYSWSASGGGGGGYGGPGGNGAGTGGGGGGYGKTAKGGDGGGGGGYYGAGGEGAGAGGGGYGNGGKSGESGGIAAGGGINASGGDGICIIQYYQ